MEAFSPFPILEYDEDVGMITPAVQKETLLDLNGIDTCVMTFFPGLDKHPIAQDMRPWYAFSAGGAELMQYVYKDSVVVANLPAGGAPCARLMEELISLGLSRFLCIGSAGLISEKVDAGKLLVVDRAIRDEGASYHYLPADETACTSPLLRQLLKDALDARRIAYQEGAVWTTDAIYRETHHRVQRRKKEGALAVEMECASLCAVAQYRGVEYAHAVYFSDYLHSDVWSGFTPGYDDLRLQALKILLDVGLQLAN